MYDVAEHVVHRTDLHDRLLDQLLHVSGLFTLVLASVLFLLDSFEHLLLVLLLILTPLLQVVHLDQI